ncbi:hypothetical protein ACELLULO517_07730 [Acidisoma cellulosilytica]|uniref:Uncharacterized protein n=1 Tax=Acidisoma cellulosilyticum TaxID=2802395 RepID=A0A963Z054_9PROT|nr:hypothetical protein [Acidisoma cellulosilyticum]MCB8880121.1 hypothetical protein [Acidisoma cellulosilyticum]
MAFEGQFDRERDGKIDADGEALGQAPAAGAHSEALGGGQAQKAGRDDNDVAFEDLKRQLDDEKRQRQNAEQGQRRAEEEAGRHRAAVATSEQSVQQANLTAVSRALEGQEALLANLRNSYAAAMAAGDYTQVADLQQKMSEAAARKVQIEVGKGQLEQAIRNGPTQNQQHGDPFEAQLARYTPRTRDWIRQHPDLLRDQRMTNLAVAAHHEAIANDFVSDSDGYFDFLDTKLGFKQAAGDQGQNGQTHGGNSSSQQQPVRRNLAAPPSRSGTAGSRQAQKADIRDMTPKHQQLAREAGLTDAEWLKNYNEGLSDGSVSPIH